MSTSTGDLALMGWISFRLQNIPMAIVAIGRNSTHHATANTAPAGHSPVLVMETAERGGGLERQRRTDGGKRRGTVGQWHGDGRPKTTRSNSNQIDNKNLNTV